MSQYDYLVVGAGLSGAVFANAVCSSSLYTRSLRSADFASR